MAGLIARLFGGKSTAAEEYPEPNLGVGGYDMPAGPAGQTGFAGSTSATRTFQGTDQTQVKIPYESPSGAQTGLTQAPVVRQASRRYGNRSPRNPRATASVAIPQDEIRYALQNNNPTEFYGGQPLKTRPGNRNVGINPLSGAAAAGGHSVRETETPATQRQPVIGVGTPGAENVRNEVAERYKNAPGQSHGYRSAPNPGHGAPQEVVVQNRFVFPGGGNQTWSVQRDMPYGGRGNGARGAALNGQRYYATHTSQDQFMNAGQGQYGVSRLSGPNHRPTQFVEPAPWSSNYVDTTESVGTADNPGSGGQSPDLTYVSPTTSRRSLNTVRRGGS